VIRLILLTDISGIL